MGFPPRTGLYLRKLEPEEKPELEEEGAEPAIPPLEKKKKLKTRASDRKKSAPIFKTPVSLKKPTKTPKKGESS